MCGDWMLKKSDVDQVKRFDQISNFAVTIKEKILSSTQSTHTADLFISQLIETLSQPYDFGINREKRTSVKGSYLPCIILTIITPSSPSTTTRWSPRKGLNIKCTLNMSVNQEHDIKEWMVKSIILMIITFTRTSPLRDVAHAKDTRRLREKPWLTDKGS